MKLTRRTLKVVSLSIIVASALASTEAASAHTARRPGHVVTYVRMVERARKGDSSFYFGGDLGSFSLNPQASGRDEAEFQVPGGHTISVTQQNGPSSLQSIRCTGAYEADTDVATSTLQITVTAAHDTVCTFTNR